MKATSFATCIGVAAILSLAPSSPAEEKLLPPTYLTGKEYQLEVQQRMQMDMSGMPGGAGAKTSMDMTMEVSATCETHDEPGQKKVTTRIDRFVMDMDSMGMKMSYDSAKEGSEETLLGQQGMGQLVDTEIVMIFDENDEVIAVEGMEALQGAQMLDQEQFQQLVNPSMQLGIAPEGVAVGDTWENDMTVSLGAQVGEMTTRMQLEYTGDETIADAPCAVIDYTGASEFDFAGAGPGGGPAGNFEMKQSNLQGVMKMDKKLRFIREGSADMTLEMQMPNPANPQQALEIPAEIEQTFSLKSVRDL